MTYDHGTKAGNRGDVWKHAVLVSVADRLTPATTLRYMESHSGAPLHAPARAGEWQRGIRAALDRGPVTAHPYLALAEEYVARGEYPAGWVFSALRLAPLAKSLLIELHDVDNDVAAEYAEPPTGPFSANTEVLFTQSDGFEAASRLEECDLVLLDPPYSPVAKADWTALARVCSRLSRRDIPYLAWYPFFWPGRPQRLVNDTGQRGWEVHWAKCGSKPSQNLKGCGMLFSEPLRALMENARPELQAVASRLDAELYERTPTSAQ